MKQINKVFSKKYLDLLFIGDIHFGNKYYDKEALDKALNYARKNKSRCRIILMGDLLELATKSSVGRSVYDEDYPTNRQFDIAVSTFKEFKDIIDCVLEGNHEERIIRDTSFEITEKMAIQMGAGKAYSKFSSILNYTVGDFTYSVYAWHGASGGVTRSGVTNALLKMRNVVIAHIYAMGHTHKLFSFPEKVALPDPANNNYKELEQLFVNTGTAVGPGGYGEQKGYAPQNTGFGLVRIYGDRRKMVFHTIDELVD